MSAIDYAWDGPNRIVRVVRYIAPKQSGLIRAVIFDGEKEVEKAVSIVGDASWSLMSFLLKRNVTFGLWAMFDKQNKGVVLTENNQVLCGYEEDGKVYACLEGGTPVLREGAEVVSLETALETIKNKLNEC